ncbi:MAG: DUF721 domain-containing protein [Myxococcota bacterium]
MRRPRRVAKPVVVGDAIGRVLGELGLDAARRAFDIGQCWEAAVGEAVARHARPLGLRGDVLEVEVASSVWAQQLQLQQGALLDALAAALPDGAERPRELRFRVGGAGASSAPRGAR